jgi:hypothetical protein
MLLNWIQALLACKKGGGEIDVWIGGRKSFSNRDDIILKFSLFRGE